MNYTKLRISAALICIASLLSLLLGSCAGEQQKQITNIRQLDGKSIGAPFLTNIQINLFMMRKKNITAPTQIWPWQSSREKFPHF